MKAKTTGKNMHCQGYFSSAIVKQVMFAMRKIARPTGRNIHFGGNFSSAIVKQVMCDVCNAKDNQNNRQDMHCPGYLS